MTQHQLQITTEPGEISVVRVVGELDLATTPLLEEALDQVADVVVDLSGVTFIGSVAIAVLLAADRRRAETGHSFRLAVPSGVVSRVLSITGLDQHFGTPSHRPTMRTTADPDLALARQQSVTGTRIE